MGTVNPGLRSLTKTAAEPPDPPPDGGGPIEDDPWADEAVEDVVEGVPYECPGSVVIFPDHVILTLRLITSSHLLWDMMAAMMKYTKRITVPRIPTLAGTKFFLFSLIL